MRTHLRLLPIGKAARERWRQRDPEGYRKWKTGQNRIFRALEKGRWTEADRIQEEAGRQEAMAASLEINTMEGAAVFIQDQGTKDWYKHPPLPLVDSERAGDEDMEADDEEEEEVNEEDGHMCQPEHSESIRPQSSREPLKEMENHSRLIPMVNDCVHAKIGVPVYDEYDLVDGQPTEAELEDGDDEDGVNENEDTLVAFPCCDPSSNSIYKHCGPGESIQCKESSKAN